MDACESGLCRRWWSEDWGLNLDREPLFFGGRLDGPSGGRDRLFAIGRAWAYASVIDNRTGDPTIVPVEVP